MLEPGCQKETKEFSTGLVLCRHPSPRELGRKQLILCCGRWAFLGSSQQATFSSRLPRAFQKFSSVREAFPEISGYCYCVDSLGRELADTGKCLPAARPLLWVVLNSQGKGQITTVSLQIHLEVQYQSHKG